VTKELSLQKFHHYLGDDFKVEFPARSGNMLTLSEVAAELSRRLSRIFPRNEKAERPVYTGLEKFKCDPSWRDLILFHEYFHGDSGRGVAIRPDGRDWSQSCCSRAASPRPAGSGNPPQDSRSPTDPLDVVIPSEARDLLLPDQKELSLLGATRNQKSKIQIWSK
jgi:hypothetical protein